MINKIMAARFLSGTSFYSFLPFFSLYLINNKNISESDAAIIIFVFLFISRAFALFTHFIIDFLNYKKTLFLSYLVSSIFIILIYFNSNFHTILLSAAFIGAGFSIANVSTSLFIAENNNHSERVKNFSILNVIVNISSAVGGAVGEWFYYGFYSGVIFFPAAIMSVSALYSLTLTDKKSTQSRQSHLWGEAVKAAGYDVKIHDVTYQEIDKINQQANLPNALRSCHTAKINGKLVVGHVPLDSLAKINTLPDDVAGIAVGGMPAGSLGMEQPSGFSQPYSVVSFKKDGSQSILKRY